MGRVPGRDEQQAGADNDDPSDFAAFFAAEGAAFPRRTGT
jgi:hypothetical protein